MLFGIPEPGWWLISIAATAFFMVSMDAFSIATIRPLPEELRRPLEQRSGRRRVLFYVVTPLFTAALLAVNLLRPEPATEILFLFSTAYVALPLALWPCRGRMVKDYIAHHQNPDPDAKIKPNRLMMAWIYAFLSVVILAAVFALMSTRYDMSL